MEEKTHQCNLLVICQITKVFFCSRFGSHDCFQLSVKNVSEVGGPCFRRCCYARDRKVLRFLREKKRFYKIFLLKKKQKHIKCCRSATSGYAEGKAEPELGSHQSAFHSKNVKRFWRNVWFAAPATNPGIWTVRVGVQVLKEHQHSAAAVP